MEIEMHNQILDPTWTTPVLRQCLFPKRVRINVLHGEIMTQEEKHFLNLAGEFLVAGELNRHSIMCSVTYGFSKQADVIALGRDNSRKSIWIEVKTTRRHEFVVGTKSLDKNYVSPNTYWVLVHLPEDDSKPPRYFILSSELLYERSTKHFAEYNTKYRERHGHDYDKPGVHKLSIAEVEDCEAEWDQIKEALK
jgi:hypothetical protein